MKKRNLSLVAGAAIFLISTSSWALAPWSVVPITPTTITVPPGVTANVQYTVTNNSVTHTLMMVPIAGISQITTGAGICSNPFTLTKGASCILSLQVNGSALTTDINSGPQVCQQGADGQPSPQMCYQPASQAASLNITTAAAALALGDSFGGGTVACLGGAPYLNLIASPAADFPSTIEWGGFGTDVLDASYPLDGATNTANIVARLTPSIQASNTYAAGLCSDYAGGGYTDWFLPAQDQLNCLYNNQGVVGGFSAASYWSSTEVSANDARIQNFNDGDQFSGLKDVTFRVRCVRALSL